MYACFPDGYQLKHAQEYAAKHLRPTDGINFAVARRDLRSSGHSTVLVVSAQPHALRKLQGSFRTPSGAELLFTPMLPEVIRCVDLLL